MHRTATFKATWSRQLKWITAITTLVLLGIPLLLLHKGSQAHSAFYAAAIWLPPAILALSALCAIRGYAVEGNSLLVLRPGWKTRVSLRGLTAAEVDPEAMRNSIRLFGNGGLFGYLGLFRSEKLGRYRAFATNATNAVVLRFPGRTLVVTPDRPQQFVAAVQRS